MLRISANLAFYLYMLFQLNIVYINPFHPYPGRRDKVNLNFHFHTLLWYMKRFYKAFIKPFEAIEELVNVIFYLTLKICMI